MSHQFSATLVERLIRYLREQRNIEITPEEANEYLHTYAEYFLTFAEIERGRAAGIRPRPELHKTFQRPLGEGALKSLVKRRPSRDMT